MAKLRTMFSTLADKANDIEQSFSKDSPGQVMKKMEENKDLLEIRYPLKLRHTWNGENS